MPGGNGTRTLPVHFLSRRFAQMRTHEPDVFAKDIKSIGMRERHPQGIEGLLDLIEFRYERLSLRLR